MSSPYRTLSDVVLLKDKLDRANIDATDMALVLNAADWSAATKLHGVFNPFQGFSTILGFRIIWRSQQAVHTIKDVYTL